MVFVNPSVSLRLPALPAAQGHSGWNKAALLTAVRNSPCSCPFSVSLTRPQDALNSEPPFAASPTGRARLESPARGDSFWLDVLYKLILSPAVRRISHCESNISLRIRAISPCVSRISSRVSALPPTSSCYSRGSGCGTRAAARWAVSA